MQQRPAHIAGRKQTHPIRVVMRTARRSNFDQVEDSKGATQKIHKMALVAVKQAAKENRRHGLAAIIIRGKQVIQAAPGRKEEVIATLKEPHRYKPGQVFYARKD